MLTFISMDRSLYFVLSKKTNMLAKISMLILLTKFTFDSQASDVQPRRLSRPFQCTQLRYIPGSQITLESTFHSNVLGHNTPIWSSTTTGNTVEQDQYLRLSTNVMTDRPAESKTTSLPGQSTEVITKSTATTTSSDMWGTQYLFTFLPPACDQAETRVRVFIATAANEDANGKIYFPSQTMVPDIVFTLQPGLGEFFDIPFVALPPDIETGQLNWHGNSTIAISADKKVVVYGFMLCSETGNVRATAFRIKAVTELGTDYRVVTEQNTGNSQVAIVALHDETFVQISHISSSLYENVTLKPYEIYILQGSYDMTGTYLRATFPVFVLVGNYADNINPSGPKGGVDAFYEVLTPFNQWGSFFSIVPLSDVQTGSIVKMLHWDDNTMISWTINGSTVTENPRGVDISRVDLFPFPDDALMEMNATDPILVAQFMTEYKDGGGSRTTPTVSMLLAPSVSQVTSNYKVFPTFDLTGAKATYHVIVWLPPNGDPNDLYVNNLTQTWQLVCYQSNGGAVVRTTLLHGSNVIENRGPYSIRAVVRGKGERRSYSFALL